MSFPDVGPFIYGATNYTMRFDYDANGNQIYLGWAQTGTATSDAFWRIAKQTFNASNQMLSITWPNGSTGFGAIWDSRDTAYSYF